MRRPERAVAPHLALSGQDTQFGASSSVPNSTKVVMSVPAAELEYHVLAFERTNEAAAFVAALSRYLNSPAGAAFVNAPATVEVWSSPGVRRADRGLPERRCARGGERGLLAGAGGREAAWRGASEGLRADHRRRPAAGGVGARRGGAAADGAVARSYGAKSVSSTEVVLEPSSSRSETASGSPTSGLTHISTSTVCSLAPDALEPVHASVLAGGLHLERRRLAARGALPGGADLPRVTADEGAPRPD